MALPSTFEDRLQQMEETRNQRLSLLQAEKELQSRKSQQLTDKLSNLRRMEQRCLLLERRGAEIGFQILASKFEIETLDARYQAAARRFRGLKREMDELEAHEKERDVFYETKSSEMEEFKEQVRSRVAECRSEVQELKDSISELKSTFMDLQGNDLYLNNPDITAAEGRKAELFAAKECLEKDLASNYQLRSLLENQLRKTLIRKTEVTY